jgi:S-adenosyl-L-methionine hydrolase (adenosine-forming)
VLGSAHPYFPAKTTFVTIVDPGVGNLDQASLLCYWPERQQAFIAPDNGLLTPIAEVSGTQLKLFDIRTSDLYINDTLSLHSRSQTFHGRDVYAPMAAQIP